MEAKIYSVSSACFHLNKSNPPQLIISAAGQVNSSGWNNGRLVPWIYVAPPSDGIQDFDFIATSPEGVVLWMLMPISGQGTIELPGWATGVRIHSSSNKVEVNLDDANCAVDFRAVSPIAVPQS
ncbi:hypothetical protein ACNVJQ_005132 [Vibrio harveyi]|uniref:hypothetical protein n=1 Tax=Vibrio TaxID=662 RepID=UPI000841CAC1|nr:MULTISPECIES: hypothetical protein [Vibrio]MCA3984181.1 hypothetical protein [Vibrio vulnificus]MCU8549423.1 hypothetical protein [Vibrio vulnificus]MCU8579901.1 hypothetical protein [Vibrio vulnificus]ODM55987.1 hypothetical protein BC455_22980 [Vibrio harveyi]